MFRAIAFSVVALASPSDSNLRGTTGISEKARRLFPTEGRRLSDCWMCEYDDAGCQNQDCQTYNGQCMSNDWLPYAAWTYNGGTSSYDWHCEYDHGSPWGPYQPAPIWTKGDHGDYAGMTCIPNAAGSDHCPSPDSYGGWDSRCGTWNAGGSVYTPLSATWVLGGDGNCWAMCDNPQGFFAKVDPFKANTACGSPDGSKVQTPMGYTMQCVGDGNSGNYGYCAYPTKSNSNPIDGRRMLSAEAVEIYKKERGLTGQGLVAYDRELHGEIVPLDHWDNHMRRLEEHRRLAAIDSAAEVIA